MRTQNMLNSHDWINTKALNNKTYLHTNALTNYAKAVNENQEVWPYNQYNR